MVRSVSGLVCEMFLKWKTILFNLAKQQKQIQLHKLFSVGIKTI